MQFPIDITLKMLGWHARVHVTDGTGRMVGYLPGRPRKPGEFAVYADERMGPPIYTIKAEHPFTQWFEDASGRKIGEFGIPVNGGAKAVKVAGEPRYTFVYGSEWLDFVDRMIPSVPVVNGVTGLMVRPTTHAVRISDHAHVLTMVKKRMMVDIRYSLRALEEISGSDRECLMLSAIIYALQDHTFKAIN